MYKTINNKQALHMWGFTKPIDMLIKGVKVKVASEVAVYITDGVHSIELLRDSGSSGERIMFTIIMEQVFRCKHCEILDVEHYEKLKAKVIATEELAAKALDEAMAIEFDKYECILSKRHVRVAEERVGYISMTNKTKQTL